MISRLLAIIVILTLSAPAFAAQPMVFRDKTRDIREASVITYLQSKQQVFADLPYRIAAVDLNGDGVDEWIVRQDRVSACEKMAACDFSIVGLSRNEPFLLGAFQARKVGIADDKIYGIRKLHVYNLKNDDFSYTTFAWKPQEATFSPQ